MLTSSAFYFFVLETLTFDKNFTQHSSRKDKFVPLYFSIKLNTKLKTNETEIIYTFKNSHILSSAKDFDEHKPVYQFCVSWLLFRSEIEDIFAPSPSPASLKYVFKRADDKFTALYKTTFKNSQISSTQNLLLYMKQRKKKKSNLCSITLTFSMASSNMRLRVILVTSLLVTSINALQVGQQLNFYHSNLAIMTKYKLLRK